MFNLDLGHDWQLGKKEAYIWVDSLINHSIS